jgi:hypothetical protein
MSRVPLAPELAVPELNINAPLMPDPPALADVISRGPLDVNVPYPDTIDTRPPVVPAAEVVEPDEITISPPKPVSPDPTVRYREPPRPFVAVPDPTYSAPLLPEFAVPVLRTSIPLDPDIPAFAVDKSKLPLDV